MRNIFDYKDNLHEMDHIPAILKWGNLEGPKPDVSILMPVYNHPHFFKKALETALNQDYKGNYEIVILDNNMDDDVNNVNEFEQYVKDKNDSKILYYKNEKNIQGINSYNRLPQLARADYFTFLHDDDELCPDCLSGLLRIQRTKGLSKELIVPSMYSIDKDSNVIIKPRRFDNRTLFGQNYKMNLYDWFLMNYTNGGGALHHRQSFLELGGYCADYIPSGDFAFYVLYVYMFGGFYYNHPLLRYRIAENDSIVSYNNCVKIGKKIRCDMIPKIHLPNSLLMRIVSAKSNVVTEKLDIVYTGELHHKSKIVDKIVMMFALFIKFLRIS